MYLCCTRSNNFFLEYSTGYAIGKGEVITRSNSRCTDLAYIHFFLTLKFFRSESIFNVILINSQIMPVSKRKAQEINVIVNSPKRRPYASKISLVLGEGMEYGFDGEACLLTNEAFIVKVKPENEKINEKGKALQKLTATIEGFPTAGKAEQMGLKLSLALLWAAVHIPQL